MKNVIIAICLCITGTVFAQVNEAGQQLETPPRDGVYEKTLMENRLTLEYDHIREADVFWEKQVWRVIDIREKQNLPFSYPKAPLAQILVDAASAGNVTAYSVVDDEFTTPLMQDELENLISRVDTQEIIDPIDYSTRLVITRDDFNAENVKRFRIKETWFFDEETSTMQVRILGIAPLKEHFDDNGNFKFETPMFWFYFPELRKVLSKEPAYSASNDLNIMSWTDLFEARMFASYIMKESNVYDRRIQHYKAGIDILYEADKIKNEIFNFEHDLWSY